MNPQSAEYAARKQKFMEKRAEVQRYFGAQGRTWLGQLLNAMTEVANANFNRDNSVQYRNEMYKVFNEFINNPKLTPVAERDPPFSACLAFSQLFGLFLEEMNERTNVSLLFQPATAQSLKFPVNGAVRGRSSMGPASSLDSDSNLPSPSDGSHIPSMAIPRRGVRFGVLGADTESESSEERETAGTSVKKTTSVDEEGRTSVSQTHIGRIREPKRRFSPTPTRVTKTPLKTPKSEIEGGRASAGADSPSKMDREGGEKVKGTRRRTQEHARKNEAGRSSLDEGGDLMEDDNEPLAKKPTMKKDESGMGGADKKGAVGGGKMKEWAANLLNKEAVCFQCKKECINYNQLSNHLYHNHQGVCQDNYIFECRGCNNQWRSYRGAMGHVEQAMRNNQVCCKNKVVYLFDAQKEVKEQPRGIDILMQGNEDAEDDSISVSL